MRLPGNKNGEAGKRIKKRSRREFQLNQKRALKAFMRRTVVGQRVRRQRNRGIRRLAGQKKILGQAMEIRQQLPDHTGEGNRRMNRRDGRVVNFQLFMFAAVVCDGRGLRRAGIMALAAAVDCLFMAGAGEQENLVMARAHGNHARSADNHQQKGHQHDAVAQCSNHGMGRIVERSLSCVKSKVSDAGTSTHPEREGKARNIFAEVRRCLLLMANGPRIWRKKGKVFIHVFGANGIFLHFHLFIIHFSVILKNIELNEINCH